MMEHLFQDLYGVDARANWEADSATPNPTSGLKGGFTAEGNGGGLWEKVAEGECKGETEREWEGGRSSLGREWGRGIAL